MEGRSSSRGMIHSSLFCRAPALGTLTRGPEDRGHAEARLLGYEGASANISAPERSSRSGWEGYL